MRAWTTMARDVVPGSAALSMIRTGIPWRVSQRAKTRPVGPAPTIRIWVSRTTGGLMFPGAVGGEFIICRPAPHEIMGHVPLPEYGARKRDLARQLRVLSSNPGPRHAAALLDPGEDVDATRAALAISVAVPASNPLLLQS